jgi:hypothetical protein
LGPQCPQPISASFVTAAPPLVVASTKYCLAGNARRDDQMKLLRGGVIAKRASMPARTSPS